MSNKPTDAGETGGDGVVVPDSLVTEAAVAAAVAGEAGPGAVVEGWQLKDFTVRGEGYSSAIRSLKVTFSKNGHTTDKMYVVKINPCRNLESFKVFTRTIFVKEAKFYQTLVPDLNSALARVGEVPLRFPRCYYASLERDREIIVMEDLRDRGFVKYDRSKSLDLPHTQLILQELARLHAASLLISSPDSPLPNQHPYLLKDWTTHNPAAPECLVPMFQAYLTQGKALLEKMGGYEAAVAWIDSLMPRVRKVLEQQVASGPLSVVCHGDCCTNNVFFRYGTDGKVEEVMFLDLQLVRYASPATDLNFFLYTSLTSDLRRPNLDSLLAHYLQTLSRILGASGQAPPFDQPQLMQEFRSRTLYGAIFAIIMVPTALLDSSKVPDIDSATDENFSEVFEEMKQNTREVLDKNPLLRPRLASLFDELMDVGVIPSV